MRHVLIAVLGLGVAVALLVPHPPAPEPPAGAGPPGLVRNRAAQDARVAAKLAAGDIHDKPDRPDGYAQQRFDMRKGPDGRVPMERLLAARERVTAMMPRGRDAGIWNWNWLGPGNIGGRIRAIAVHPGDSDILWIGSVAGGIWKTTNGGDTWSAANDFLPSLAITQIVLDPNDPDVLYASTGEGFFNSDALPGAGIFKSTNGGSTWNVLPGTTGSSSRFVNDLAHDPATSDVLYAAVAPDWNDGELWKTLNGGQTWTPIMATSTRITDVKVDPDDPDFVVIGTRGVRDSTGTYSAGDVWISTNGGGTWDQQTSGIPNHLPTDLGRCEIAIAGNGHDVIYVSADRFGGEIYRSTNQGATWSLRNPGGGGYLGGQGWYDNVIWVDPTDTDRILVGGIDLWRSTNGGASSTRISDWTEYHTGQSAHADHHAIVPDPGWNGTTNTRMFFGNDGGIQKAENVLTVSRLSGWTNLANGLGITQFYGGAASVTGGTIVGGAQDNSTLRLTSGGVDGWYQATTGDGTYCAISPGNQNVIYMSHQELRMRKSTNGGTFYFHITSGLGDAGGPCLFIAPFAMDRSRPDTLYAGGESLWRTTNGGGGWSSVYGPRFNSPLCSAIEVTPLDADVVWFGYTDGDLVVTTDAGTSFSQADNLNQVPARWVTDIEASHHDPDILALTLGEYEPDNVFLSFDGGASWVQRTGSGETALPAVQANCVSFHPSHPDWIYVGTDVGLFASEDLGATWGVTSRYGDSEGPVYTEVSDIQWHSGNTLVAFTHGRGAFWCRPLDVVFVDGGYGGTERGTFTQPWDTAGEGFGAIGHGATLSLDAGTYDEGSHFVDKRITVTATGGTVLIQ